jgi:hypothetical protein
MAAGIGHGKALLLLAALAIIVGGTVGVVYLVTECCNRTTTNLKGASEHIDKAANSPSNFIKSITDAFKPTYNVSGSVTAFANRVQAESKLVVLTQSLDVEVVRTDELRILDTHVGTAWVRMLFRGNKVQYYVPMKPPAADNCSFDPRTRKLTVRVAAPVLDEGLVEVQSDPAMIEVDREKGRFRSTSVVEGLEAEAKAAIRGSVLAAAKESHRDADAREQGKKVIAGFFKDWVDHLADGVTLEIVYE